MGQRRHGWMGIITCTSAANVLLGRLLPPGTIVRRNFSFQPGEKSLVTVSIAKSWTACWPAATAHRLLFSLPPLDHPAVSSVFLLGKRFTIEVETHPVAQKNTVSCWGKNFFD